MWINYKAGFRKFVLADWMFRDHTALHKIFAADGSKVVKVNGGTPFEKSRRDIKQEAKQELWLWNQNFNLGISWAELRNFVFVRRRLFSPYPIVANKRHFGFELVSLEVADTTMYNLRAKDESTTLSVRSNNTRRACAFVTWRSRPVSK